MVTIVLQYLAQGVHVLSLRLKDEDGVCTFSKAIMVNPALSSRTILIQAVIRI